MAIQIRTNLAEPETGQSFVPHRPARPQKAEGGKRFDLVSELDLAITVRDLDVALRAHGLLHPVINDPIGLQRAHADADFNIA